MMLFADLSVPASVTLQGATCACIAVSARRGHCRRWRLRQGLISWRFSRPLYYYNIRRLPGSSISVILFDDANAVADFSSCPSLDRCNLPVGFLLGYGTLILLYEHFYLFSGINLINVGEWALVQMINALTRASEAVRINVR
jgi:hypothetical protein